MSLLPHWPVMARTPEERMTNEGIERAINAFREAYRDNHPEATHGTLTDWIVVAAEIKPDMENPDDDVTAYSIIMAGGSIPWYRAYGLLRAGMHYLDLPQEDNE